MCISAQARSVSIPRAKRCHFVSLCPGLVVVRPGIPHLPVHATDRSHLVRGGCDQLLRRAAADDRTVREKIAAREHAESAGIFDLLAVIGRDCVGALRFVPEGADPGDPTKMEYRPVTDDEIAARLAALGTNPSAVCR